MIVAISVKSDSPEAKIDLRFGRCNYFTIIDTETNDISFIKNHSKDSGSGINAANTVLNAKIDTVIVGNIGPKAFQVLNKADITIYEGFEGTINDNMEKLKNGALNKLSSPNR